MKAKQLTSPSTRILLWIAVLGLQALAANPGFVVTYPTEPTSSLSTTYTVTVNGTSVPVYNANEISYVHFAFAGEIVVKVTVKEAVNSYTLTPVSLSLASTKSGRDITFSLDRPRKLLLRNVNSLTERLAIFADPPEEAPPVLGATGVKNIMDYSVDNLGTQDNTTKIQQAITALPANGVLYFPAGAYRFSNISLKSNMTLYLSGGAMLKALQSTNLNSSDNMVSLGGCTNTKILGRGSIDGNGYYLRSNNGGGEVGPVMIRVPNGSPSSNVLIQDVIIKNAPIWTVAVFNVTNWKFYNAKIVSDNRYPNRDGIDPLGACPGFTVDNTFIYTSDDCMAPNPFTDNQDMGLTVRNSLFYNNNSGCNLRMGPSCGNNVGNVVMENMDFLSDASNDFAISLYPGGGLLKNLRFRNIRIEKQASAFTLFRTQWNYSSYSSGSGQVENIIFSEIKQQAFPTNTGQWNNYSLLETPSSSNYIKGVTFNNYTIAGNAVTSASTGHITAGGSVTNLTFSSNPSPIIGISATDLIADKSSSNPGQFTITRFGSTTSALTIRYTIRGTATNGTDYASIANSLTLPAGSASSTISVAPKTTATIVDYKTAMISLDGDTTYMVGPEYHAMVTLVPSATSVALAERPAQRLQQIGLRMMPRVRIDTPSEIAYDIRGCRIAPTTMVGRGRVIISDRSR